MGPEMIIFVLKMALLQINPDEPYVIFNHYYWFNNKFKTITFL